MFISNNRTWFHLWRQESLVKYQKVSKYYANDCRSASEYFFNGAHSEKLQEQFYTSIYKNRILLPLTELFNILIQAIKDT